MRFSTARVGVISYADDTLVTARGKSYRQVAINATAGVAHVVGRIRWLGLKVALHKSEALCFHGPRTKLPPGSSIIVGGVSNRCRVNDEVPRTCPRQSVELQAALYAVRPPFVECCFYAFALVAH